MPKPGMFAPPRLAAAADEIRMQMAEAAIRGLTANEPVDSAGHDDN